MPVDDRNYHSGEDYVVEFVGHRYGFSADDFRERVVAAAIRLGVVRAREVGPAAADDLARLCWSGTLEHPASPLGAYLLGHWDELSSRDGESLVYWLRKLLFRGAWLDHRLKMGLLEAEWDEAAADFRYRLPTSERPLVDVASHPSWHAVGYAGS